MKIFLSRWVSGALLPFFTLFVVMLPARDVYAISFDNSAPFGIELESLSGEGLLAFPAVQVGVIAFATGTFVGHAALCPLATIFDPSSTIGQQCLTAPTSTATGAGAIKPPPPAPATSSTVTGYYIYYNGYASPIDTSQSASCDHFAAWFGPSYNGVESSNACAIYLNGVYQNVDVGINTTVTCPAGYTLSGSTCNLTNPYAVDSGYSNYDASRSALTVTLQTGTSNTSGPESPHIISVNNPSDTVIVQGLNGDGSGTPLPQIVGITNNSDGGSTITQQQWTSPSQFVQTQTTIDGTGQVIGNQQTIQNGYPPVSSSTSGFASTSNNPSNQPASGVYVTNPSLSNPTGTIPSGYAASAVDANKVASDTTQITSAVSNLSSTGENTADEGYFNHTWEWYMPGHLTYTCSDLYNLGFFGNGSGASSSGPPSLSVAGLSFQLPDICSGGYVDDIRMAMDWVMGTYVAYYVFNLIFFKEE